MRQKLFFGMMVALMAVVATSCKKATYLKADKTSVEFTIEGGTETVQLSSDVTNFSVEDAPEWVETKMEDSTLTVTVAENTTGAKREGKIIVSVRGQEAAIPVVQYFEATHLSVNVESVVIPKEGGTQDVDVDCDGAVTVDAPGFVTANYSMGKLTITASANDGGSQKAPIKLTSGNYSAEIAVTLEGNICPTCNGTGKVRCTKCGGRGYTETSDYIDADFIIYTDYGCKQCGGKGWTDSVEGDNGGYRQGSGKMKCPTCGGTGR